MTFSLQEPNSITVVQRALAEEKAKGKKVGLTSGCFDLIHFQHFQFFLRCRRNCDFLIVGVDSDELVRSEKGPSRPINPDYHRGIMVGALKPVSFMFIMNSVDDFGKVAELMKPDIIFKNQAFKGREKEVVGGEHAGKVMILDDQIDHSSTTSIINHVSGRVMPVLTPSAS
jgi:cytidyltransferase-like protein